MGKRDPRAFYVTHAKDVTVLRNVIRSRRFHSWRVRRVEGGQYWRLVRHSRTLGMPPIPDLRIIVPERHVPFLSGAVEEALRDNVKALNA